LENNETKRWIYVGWIRWLIKRNESEILWRYRKFEDKKLFQKLSLWIIENFIKNSNNFCSQNLQFHPTNSFSASSNFFHHLTYVFTTQSTFPQPYWQNFSHCRQDQSHFLLLFLNRTKTARWLLPSASCAIESDKVPMITNIKASAKHKI
jgi:hypothetical protein